MRHLTEQKLRSLRRQTCTARPQFQQISVFLILVTPHNAKTGNTRNAAAAPVASQAPPAPAERASCDGGRGLS